MNSRQILRTAQPELASGLRATTQPFGGSTISLPLWPNPPAESMRFGPQSEFRPSPSEDSVPREWSVEARLGTASGFSLIEIMISMVLLSFIVLGLLAMFHQVQKSFRSSMTQVDVFEAGRSMTDEVARELEQMVPGQFSYTNAANNLNNPAINFFAFVSPDFSQGLHQQLPGSTIERTNVIQTMFFLSKVNQDYIGTGYQVRPDYLNAGLGTLYRYSTNVPKARARGLSQQFLSALPPLGVAPTNLNRVADGVIHFRVRAFDTNGVPIVLPVNGTTLAFPVTINRVMIGITNSFGSYDSLNDQYNYFFLSNAVPASLEFEIGFLEPHLVDKYRAIAAGQNPPVQALQDAQRLFLTNHVANVHLFRQRVPIRNVDFRAYQ